MLQVSRDGRLLIPVDARSIPIVPRKRKLLLGLDKGGAGKRLAKERAATNETRWHVGYESSNDLFHLTNVHKTELTARK